LKFESSRLKLTAIIKNIIIRYSILMASILKKAAKYRTISQVLIEGEAHLKDPFIQPPQILKPAS
jgi:hypothetical protein